MQPDSELLSVEKEGEQDLDDDDSENIESIHFDLINNTSGQTSTHLISPSIKTSKPLSKSNSSLDIVVVSRSASTSSDDSSTRDTTYDLYFSRWLVLASYCMLTTSCSSAWLCFPAVSNIIKGYYNCNLLSVFFLSFVFAIALVLLSLPFAYILDQTGLGVMLKLAAMFNLIGAIIRYFGDDQEYGYWLLLVGNTFSAISVASFLFLPGKIASTWFGCNELGIATAVCIGFDSLGAGVGFLHATLMITNSDDTSVVKKNIKNFLLSQLVPAVFIFIFILIFVKKKPPSPPSLMEQERIRSKQNYKQNKLISNNKRASIISSIIDIDELRCWTDHFTFKQSVIALLKNKDFHLICHIHGMTAVIESIYEMMLNEMLIPMFPGYERSIGIIGFVSILLGFVSNIVTGIVLDRTKSYRVVSFVIFASTSVCCGLWVFFLEFYLQFVVNAVIVCLLMFSVTAYYTVAFAHSAQVTFPVSSGVTGMMLILTSQIYDTILMFIMAAVLDRFGATPVNLIGTCFAIMATVFSLLIANKSSTSVTTENAEPNEV